jgi:hypothetical protein
MAEIKEIRFDTWGDFKRDLVTELFADGTYRRGDHLFRGMRSPLWRLEASFDRVFRDVEAGRRTKLFETLVESFREVCRDHGIPEALYRDDRQLIALGQHHGLPTRLLDWSSSPYVAAFFAYQDMLVTPNGSDSHVALWALHRRCYVWSGDYGVEIVSAPSFHNVRARNQSGFFTWSRSPFDCLEDFVRTCTAVPGTALTQILLPAEEVRFALADLDLMGISALHLFPDLAGAAAACSTRLQLEHLTD